MTLDEELSQDQLFKYLGTNPKPLDFDNFWKDGLEEIYNIEPNIALEKADFETTYCECFHMYFTSTKNSRVYAKLLRPKSQKKPGPGLLMFHGYSGNSGGWSEKPTKLGYVAAGFTVAAMDCRGQGGKSIDSGNRLGWSLRGHIVRGIQDKEDNLYYRDVYLDTVQLARVLMSFKNVDRDRIGVTGESQGGGLSIACASLVPEIKRVAPIFPFLCDYKRAWEFDTSDNAYIEIREYLRRFHPDGQLTNEIFYKLGYIDVQHLANRVKGKTLMGIGLLDSRCPPSTQFAVYNKLLCEKELSIYPNYGHERLPGHNDKIFEFLKTL